MAREFKVKDLEMFKFSNEVKTHGYKQSQADHTMFIQHTGNGKLTVLIVYVDDIIISGNDVVEIKNIKKQMAREFEVKDLGMLKYFLGMEIARSKQGISVSQRKYTLDLLEETGKLDLSLVSQYMHNPCQGHMDPVYRILKYLKQTLGKGLFIRKLEDRTIKVFTDADWAGSIDDRKSTLGYCTLVWGNFVTWRSKKQNVVARSSAEAEYRAMAHRVCEFSLLLNKLGLINIYRPA
ncbi:hypothetical protein LIER_36630 [Lithospermum erythrorhizon]|uniref:Reverse transcriptase Ty1/copia-type domain-containing protein n=1 Tax=Lithospermum erythrorhizon TaxID=34254 RepID=A0AAV3P8J5_LITER